MAKADAALVKRLLRYNPETGALIWLPRWPELFAVNGQRSREGSCAYWNSRYAGKPALATLDGQGYLHGNLLGYRTKAHRVAMCLMLGRWPSQVDHINGNRVDNRACNLREVTAAENSRNQKLRSSNISGVPGVTWDTRRRRWMVRCARKPVGRFSSLNDAIAARREAERREGFHQNHGRI